MSINSVGGQDAGTSIRTKISDTDSANYEFTDVDINNLLISAIRYYSRYNPYYLKSTLTTIADQDVYALPSDCIRVVSHDWRPYPGWDTAVAYLSVLYGTTGIVPSGDWSDDVLSKIRQELTARFDAIGAGEAEQITYLTSYSPTGYLILYPTPVNAGDTVTIRYSAQHPLLSGDYFTCPAQHVELIEKLVIAEVDEIRARKISTAPDDFAAGTTRFGYRNSASGLIRDAMRLRQEIADIFAGMVAKYG